MRIGVLMPNWVGDVAMATPMLRALSQTFPAAELVAVGRPHLRPILAGTRWVHRWIDWDYRGSAGPIQTWNAIRELRGLHLDTLLLLRNSMRAAALAALSAAQRTVGYVRRGTGLFLTHALQPPRAGGNLAPISAVDYFLALADAIGSGAEPKKYLELATLSEDERAADAFWQRMNLPDPQQVVLLNLGGAYGAAKHWPREHASALARRIAVKLGLGVLVLCGPDERAQAAGIATAAGHRRVKSCAGEDVGFGITKAIIRRSRLLVTTDSGPRHLAAGLSTPTITLFGPIDPRWSENYQRDAIQLRLPLECSPCGRRTCPLHHHRCLRELAPDRVFQAVVQLLERKQLPLAA
jgi:heptosyltransferase-2